MKQTLLILVLVGLMVTSIFAQGANEASYPSRQVNVLVGASPGGNSDAFSRYVAASLEKQLGAPFIVNNKPGGSCSVAFEYMAAQKPDGYTMMYMPVESAMVKALGLTKLEPSDVRYIGRIVTISAAVTVNASSPWNTFEELIAYAKANPGKVTVGNSGTGSIWHLAAVGVEQAFGVKFNHVPFDGGAVAAAAVMGKHVDVTTVSPGEVLSGVKGGDLKVLAIIGDVRSELYPDVPSFKELGSDFYIRNWGAFAVPKETPDDVVAVLEKALANTVQSQEFKDLSSRWGQTPAYLSADETQKFVEEQAIWYQTEIPKLGL